jgi:3-deoxy-D-manno-octulosonic-acid transferase
MQTRLISALIMTFYSLFYCLAFFILLPYFFYQMRKHNKYCQGISQRFGFFSPLLKEQLKQQNNIWIHAVSVGELIAAGPLIYALKKQYPSYHCVITTTTYTSQTLAHKRYASQATVLYAPLDFPLVTQKYHSIIQPKIFCIMETELWPNMIYHTNKKNCRAYLVNARLSEKSRQKYALLQGFFKHLLLRFDHICVQSERDLKRFLDIGVPATQLNVTGQFKYEVASQVTELWGKQISPLLSEDADRYLMAASTHPGEDQIILDLYSDLKKEMPQLKLLLAPRHPERCPDIIKIIQQSQLTVTLWNAIQETSPCSLQTEVLLINTIGDLPLFYTIASLVIMGGSFVPHGGQNPLEAAALGKAIITGPHMFNFQDILEELVAHHGIVQLKDKQELLRSARELLQDRTKATAIGKAAQKSIDNNLGSVDKTLAIIVNK